MNMYVSNLGFQLQDSDLQQLFCVFGDVASAKIIKDRETGRSRGFGFVEMPSADQANTAMKALNNREISGRAMSVSVAKEKENRTPRVW
ncbi:MAG: RNA-binding protein [Chitinophagaceae bacterium]|nr:RNA-binding protein [Chitinophagaceae bacterium]